MSSQSIEQTLSEAEQLSPSGIPVVSNGSSHDEPPAFESNCTIGTSKAENAQIIAQYLRLRRVRSDESDSPSQIRQECTDGSFSESPRQLRRVRSDESDSPMQIKRQSFSDSPRQFRRFRNDGSSPESPSRSQQVRDADDSHALSMKVYDMCERLSNQLGMLDTKLDASIDAIHNSISDTSSNLHKKLDVIMKTANSSWLQRSSGSEHSRSGQYSYSMRKSTPMLIPTPSVPAQEDHADNRMLPVPLDNEQWVHPLPDIEQQSIESNSSEGPGQDLFPRAMTGAGISSAGLSSAGLSSAAQSSTGLSMTSQKPRDVAVALFANQSLDDLVTHTPSGRLAISDTNRTDVMTGLQFFGVKQRIYCGQNRQPWMHSIWMFLDEPESGFLATAFATIMPTIIILSVLSTLTRSLQEQLFSSEEAMVVELVFDIIFTLEYVSRLIASPHTRSFVFKIYSLIDLLASIPPMSVRLFEFLTFQESTTLHPAQFFLACVVPVLRLLKLLRRFEKFNLLLSAFNAAFQAVPFLLVTFSLMVMVSAALIYAVEPQSNISSFGEALWLSIVTATTIGYGDVVPVSELGRAAVACLVIVSQWYSAIPLGIVGSSFSERWEDRDRLLLMARMRDRLHVSGYRAHDIPQLFHLFDSNKDGRLSLREFRDMLSALKIGVDDERVFNLFESLNSNGSGAIDDSEFVRALFPEAHHTLYESD